MIALRTVRNTSGAKRVPDSSKRRAEICAVAAEVFGKFGFAHATMRDVADATGILAGSLYYHFSSKDALLLEIMEKFSADILRDMHAAIDGEVDPLVRITNLIHLALRYILERSHEARILNNDAHYITQSPALASIAEGARAAEELWVSELSNSIEAGVLRSDLDPKITYATLMGAIFSALRWYRSSGPVSPEKFTEHVAEQLLRGVVVRED